MQNNKKLRLEVAKVRQSLHQTSDDTQGGVCILCGYDTPGIVDKHLRGVMRGISAKKG